MKRYWHFLLPALALLLQPLPYSFILRFPRYVYGRARFVPESWEWAASIGVLGLLSLAILVCGTLGAYLLLRRNRLVVAAPVILFCCFPALVGAAVYLHALLVFLTLV